MLNIFSFAYMLIAHYTINLTANAEEQIGTLKTKYIVNVRPSSCLAKPAGVYSAYIVSRRPIILSSIQSLLNLKETNRCTLRTI